MNNRTHTNTQQNTHSNTHSNIQAVTRRDLFKRTAFAGGAASASLLGGLSALGTASAQSATGYKALVCVYLNGGNDQSNTVVPTTNAAYNAYAAARPGLAVAQNSLLGLNPSGWAGQAIGLNAQLASLKTLFDQGKVALLANVGTLARPMSLAQWNNGSPTVTAPYQLFSHSDQQGAWHTGIPDQPSATGWLGRMGDLMAAGYNPNSLVSTTLSVAGNSVMLAGNTTIQYQVTTQGAVRVAALNGLMGSNAGAQALRALMSQPKTHMLESELNLIGKRAFDCESQITQSLAANPVNTAAFPNTDLGKQLAMVARLIASRSSLSHTRQIFYVEAGGFDFHDNLVADQTPRLRDLSDSLAAFYQATQSLGVANNVTAFTASDFGRALQSNGRGSDHGWGSHHFIVGGAVLGNRVFGEFPDVRLGGAQDAGQGRLLPSTSVDEYAATLARWLGVSASDMQTVLPNAGRFASANLGFMA